jgi:hypothetical protein
MTIDPLDGSDQRLLPAAREAKCHDAPNIALALFENVPDV